MPFDRDYAQELRLTLVFLLLCCTTDLSSFVQLGQGSPRAASSSTAHTVLVLCSHVLCRLWDVFDAVRFRGRPYGTTIHGAGSPTYCVVLRFHHRCFVFDPKVCRISGCVSGESVDNGRR